MFGRVLLYIEFFIVLGLTCFFLVSIIINSIYSLEVFLVIIVLLIAEIILLHLMTYEVIITDDMILYRSLLKKSESIDISRFRKEVKHVKTFRSYLTVLYFKKNNHKYTKKVIRFSGETIINDLKNRGFHVVEYSILGRPY